MASSFVQVCQAEIINGSCSAPLVWIEAGSTIPLTAEQFLSMSPYIAGILFSAWSIKHLIKLILNSR